ncbi:MAG: MFS transporter [Chitinispirillales bacterium]|jgi:MFS family permease|nr:MFS transporter [Chitinispirillales bacterium]
MKYPKTRLSLLMFIQFFIWGATGPVMSLYLKECLGFSGAQIGLILGLSAMSSVFSPLIMTFVADRIVSSERLLCALNAAGGACMALFSLQRGFYPALAAYIVYYIAVSPTVPLINAITFHHAPTERRKFGNIRVWGTVGWISVAWFFSFGVLRGWDGAAQGAGQEGSRLPLLLAISAAASFIMAAYCLTIPKRAPAGIPADGGSEPPRLFPAGAFKVMMRPQALALSIVTAAITFVDKFYTVGTAPFLRQFGLSEKAIMPAMSLGQIPEIAAMGALGYMLKRWGAKRVLMAGMAMEIFRFGASAAGSSALLVYAGLSVHGLAYTFTMVTAVICLDGFCCERDRSGVHQLFNVATGGLGGFLGSYAAGRIADLFTDSAGTVDYGAYWAVPLAISAIIFVTIPIVWRSNGKVH